MIQTYYEKSMKLWAAYYCDSIGQLGDAEFADTKELACFNLGLEMGRNPQKFARPINEYFDLEVSE